MKNFKTKLTNFILILAFAVILFGSGYKLGQYQISNSFSSSASDQQLPNADFNLLVDVWNQLQSKYVDKMKLNSQQMVYGAIKGMVATINDPYTFFLTPDENRQAKNDLEGKFEGIGAELGLKDNRIVVIAPLKKSPAEKAGIRTGDFINAVDGKKTTSWTLSEAVSKIRGPKGTKIQLTLERNGKEYTVTITRDQITIASVDLSFDKNVAVLKLNQFGDNTNAEWDKAVTEIKTKWQAKQIKGMILDLRDNPGGYLESSVYLASDFLKPGDLIVKQESTVTPSHDYVVDRDGRLLDIPLVVLINKGSASASEILAGSLRDHKRAQLVGEKSFGKGSVQEAIDLNQGAGLHVTVAKWILPNGDWINGKGIEPNVTVLNKTDQNNTVTPQTDAQLEKALELLPK